MEGTSCGANCPFVKQGFCKEERECPHYVESWWQDGHTQERKLIKDCSPKRMLLQQQHLQARLECVQAALEQSRNESVQLCSYFKNLIEVSQGVIQNQSKLIEVQYAKNNLLIGDSDSVR